MPNLVEVVVRVRTDRSGWAEAELAARRAGERAGQAFTDGFQRRAKSSVSNFGSGHFGSGALGRALIPGGRGSSGGRGGIFNSAANAIIGLGASGSGAASGVPGLGAIGGALGGPGMAAAAAVGLAALPALATAAAGGIIGAIGGAFTAVGVIAATHNKGVERSFTHLKNHASSELTKISGPFVTMLKGIAGTADKAIGPIGNTLGKIFKQIAPPLGNIVNSFIKGFASPTMQTAIQNIGKAFASFLKAFAPQIPGIVNALASGLNTMATAFTNHPEMIHAMAAVLAFLLKLPGYIASALGWLVNLADWMGKRFVSNVNSIHKTFDDFRHRTAVVFDGVRHEIAHIWDLIWNNTVGRIIRGYQDVVRWFDNLRHGIASKFDTIRHDIAHVWDVIWQNTVGRIQRGISDAVSWVKGIPGRFLGVLGKAGSTLWQWGKDAINGLKNGMVSVIQDVWNFIKGIPGKILSFLGIHSPPQWAIDAGKHIMNGIGIGMGKARSVLKNATAAFKSAFTGSGEGVTRWIPLIQQALKMEGLDSGLLRNVLIQMQSESGGKPNAINLWDANAARHDPSRGLMQVIGSTFQAYHWPGTSWDIYDPLANIAAALNYARHVYGPTLMSGGMGIGSGHGYAAGGPGTGGWRWVGEHGRELLRLPPSSRVFSNADSEAMGGAVRLFISLELGDSFRRAGLTDEQIRDIKYSVRTLGGGNVQTAFGGKH